MRELRMEVAAESLLALKKRFGISQAEVRGVVAQALDALADAYDGRGGRWRGLVLRLARVRADALEHGGEAVGALRR